jgi:hypothetical protein
MLVRAFSKPSLARSVRDAAVYDKPKLMSADVLHRLLQRIEEHVVRHSLVDFPTPVGAGHRAAKVSNARWRRQQWCPRKTNERQLQAP